MVKARKLKIDSSKLRKLKKSKNPYASLVRSIIFQQLATKAADSIYKKFLELFKLDKKKNFPSPKEVLLKTPAQLKKAGISAQKASYLHDLSKKFLDGSIDHKKFHKMKDEEIREHLIVVKGIGRWSADMFLIFALNRPNILPVGDLGIQHGFRIAYKLKSLPSERTMKMLAKPHEGEYTKLSLYLWDVKDKKKEI